MDLHLNLKKCYFEQVLSGEKKEEYREYNDYWKKRLVGKKYQKVIVKMGYPKKYNDSRQIVKPYKGYIVKSIFHEHFNGGKCTKVFAINLG